MIFDVRIANDSFRVEEVSTEEALELFAVWNAARNIISEEPKIKLGFTTFSIDEEGNYMLLLTVTQKCSLTLDPRDAKGNPAPLDGAPMWSSSDTSIVTVQTSQNGLAAEVVAVGVVGNAQVNVTADARIGPDVVSISGTLDVSVLAGEAVTLGISTGTPEEQ